MASNAVYEIITDRILKMLDEGVVPWRKPWHAETDLPRSIRNRAYRGINVWLLLFRGYTDPRWLTYKQAVELGGVVKRGEKGTPVVLWKRLEIEDEDENGNPVKKTIPFLRYYTVFNVEQTEGCNIKPLPTVEGKQHDPIASAEAIIAGYADKPPVKFGGGRACYMPTEDSIRLPKKETFDKAEEFYTTEFHEFGHSTGHKSRLNREGVENFDHFGSGQYSREELIAEMTAAFLAGEAGIEQATLANSAAYIGSWKQKLQEDPRAVVVAAGAAQKAADYILGRNKAEEKKEEEK